MRGRAVALLFLSVWAFTPYCSESFYYTFLKLVLFVYHLVITCHCIDGGVSLSAPAVVELEEEVSKNITITARWDKHSNTLCCQSSWLFMILMGSFCLNILCVVLKICIAFFFCSSPLNVTVYIYFSITYNSTNISSTILLPEEAR